MESSERINEGTSEEKGGAEEEREDGGWLRDVELWCDLGERKASKLLAKSFLWNKDEFDFCVHIWN